MVENFKELGIVTHRTGRKRILVSEKTGQRANSYFRGNPKMSLKKGVADSGIPYSIIQNSLK